jgi:hypothetical protein
MAVTPSFALTDRMESAPSPSRSTIASAVSAIREEDRDLGRGMVDNTPDSGTKVQDETLPEKDMM